MAGKSINFYKVYSIRKKSCREATKIEHAISRRSPLEFQMFWENRAKADTIYHDKYYCHRYSIRIKSCREAKKNRACDIPP